MERSVDNLENLDTIAPMEATLTEQDRLEIRKQRAKERGELVKRLRKQSRFKTQERLASASGCKKSYVSLIEKGRDFDIKGTIQIRMAEALGIEPYELSLEKPTRGTDKRALVKLIDGVDNAFTRLRRTLPTEEKAELVALLTPFYRDSHTVEDIAEFVLNLIEYKQSS